MKLIQNWENKKELEQDSIRNGFGKALLQFGEENKDVVALCADLTESTRVHWFREKFPERFFEVGVAEQNLMGISAGLALAGKIPFAASYAVFSPGRNWDQLRVSVCYSKANVKIIGGHAGISVGPDGATHQALEDIAITRVLPNIVVVVPADRNEAYNATLAIGKHIGPSYLRLSRIDSPVFLEKESKFEIGKANVLKEGTDVTIIACGIMVYEALQSALELEKEGISAEVINNHTIKPLDEKTILESVKKTGKLVTAEEHQKAGGMGSAIVEFLAQENPVPTKLVGAEDTFGESGQADELLKKYKMTKEDIIGAVKELL